MGRAKVLSYYNGRYKGNLDDNTCMILDKLRDIEEVSDLRHVIYNLNKFTVTDIINTYDAYGVLPLVVDKPLGNLAPYQTVGVAYMYWAKRMILGDSVGLGKTVQIAGLCNLLEKENEKQGKPFRYLFLTEKTLVSETRDKMVRFTGDYVHKLYGDAPSCNKFVDLVGLDLEHSIVGSHTLVNQKIFMNWILQFDEFPFDLIIVDESSVLGNSTTNITQNMKSLFKYCARVILLNATPFESNLSTLYTQLDLLDKTYLPTKTNFNAEYVVYDYRGFYKKPSGKYKNTDSFRHLVGYRYFARTRKGLGAIFENCSADIIKSPLSQSQKKLMPTTSLWRMVCDCPNYFDDTLEFNEENVPKLGSLARLLKSDLSGVESILLYAPYLEAQAGLSEFLESLGVSHRILHGGTKQKERDIIINDFKEKMYRVLITNVQKGLDFGHCNHIILYSYNPNPQKMVQFEGRATRDFDIIDKHLYLLCSEGKEYKYLDTTIRERAKASSQMTYTDDSCIMTILLDSMKDKI